MDNITPPDVLYHYTTQDGLLGILKDGAIWATKIQYLNDASELVMPLQIAQRVLKTRSTQINDNDTRRKEIVVRMLAEIKDSEQLNICVFSFCKDGDLLSQWRAYGARGSAYSIGFHSEELVKSLTPSLFELHQCVYYEVNEQNSIIERFVDQYIEASLQNSQEVTGFIAGFVNMASKMKHKSFEEEDEWRLMSSKPLSFIKDLSFRPGISTIVPYYSLPINLSSIMEIIVGPSPHPELAKGAVEGLVFKFQLEWVEPRQIKTSQIPYRNW